MTHEQWNNGLNHLDPALIEEYVLQKDRAAYRKPVKRLYLRVVAAAACVCILLGAVTVGFFLQDRPPAGLPTPDTTDIEETTVPQDSDLFDPIIHSGTLNGWQSQSVISNSSGGSGITGEPPAFRFASGGIVVKAAISKIYPDSYYAMTTHFSGTFRLIQFHTEQVIHGENVPQDFVYLLPKYLFVDLTPYDTFILSITQVGTKGFVVRNTSQEHFEALQLPVFGDYQNYPELGNVIAFTDGVFNEGLWQNESWLYGYQFGRGYLDNPQHNPSMVVFRGCTVEDTIQAIHKQIDEIYAHNPDKQPTAVESLNFTSEEALAAMEFIKPFENGVFLQELRLKYYGSPHVIYRRFINGCQTDETITIYIDTEEVIYSEVRYSEEDIAGLPDIPLHVSELAAQYKESTPTPPHHIQTDGKSLFDLRVYGWYVKVDDTVYGVIRTTWVYDEEISEHPGWLYYYDDAYLLFDPQEDSPRPIDRDELIKLVGTRNVYTGNYTPATEYEADFFWLIYGR